MPAIEYSFFPYYEFVRREMVLNYRIGYGYRNYIEGIDTTTVLIAM